MLAARNSPPTQGVKCAPEGGSSRGAHQLPKPKILRPPPILTPQAPEMPCRWSCRQCRPRRRGLVTLCSVHRQAKAVLREVMDEKFQIVKEIGKGGFGIVHEAVNVKTGAHYAIKTMRLPRGLAAREKQQAEIDVLTRVGRCLNICTLFEVLETPGFVHLVMELCTGGTLAGRLTNESGELYSEARVAELMRDILRTVAQCHKCNVVHRDIKPENFLFHHPGEGAPLKAIDFGLAVYAPRGTVLTERCGTAQFIAPEVVKRSYGPPADVWSAGVTAYLLLSGTLPFAASQVNDFAEEDIFQMVLENEIDFDSGSWATVSKGAKDFVKSLLQKDPRKRPTAIEALQHPWVREGGSGAANPEAKLSSTVVQRLQMYGTFGRLKKAALRRLAAKISRSDDPQVERLRELYFEFGGELDGSMDGSYRPLSFQNLRRGIEELSQAGGNHLTSAEIWEIASQMEERSDECEVAFFDFDERVDDPPQDCADIGFEDLLSSLLNWEMVQQRPDWRSMAEEVFASMDRDGDGTLDLKELQAGLLPTEDVGDLREMLAEVDGVKDGHISLPVFLDMLRSEAADSLELYPAIGSAQFASVDRR